MFGTGFGFGAAGCGVGGIFIGLLLIGLLIYIMKNRSGNNESNRKNSNEQTLDLLKIRFAKGEITAEEFQQMKDTIIK